MVTRLSGGLTPADGADPRTFPAIWNVTADEIEAQGTAITGAESDIDTLEGKNIPAFGTATPSDGQVLTFDSAGSEFVPEDVATTLADLTDTDITSPVSGEVLEYDGTNWVNAVLPAGGKILQVVRATDTTNRTSASASFSDANISVTITPESASSNLIVVWSVLTLSGGSPNSRLGGFLQITDSSNVPLSGAENARSFIDLTTASLDFHADDLLLVGFVSAGSTSPRTYKGRFRRSTGLNIQLSNATKTGQIFAIEVAA